MHTMPGAQRPAHPVRLGVVRAWLVVGVIAVASAEAFSALGILSRGWVALLWATVAAAALAGWWLRAGRGGRRNLRDLARGARGRVSAWWHSSTRLERAAAVVLLGLLFAELVVAILASPNNYDSQTYHLPKVEHWVADRSVAFYPAGIDRQVDLPPGAEYLLLQLRLLTGGDVLYNFVQYLAGLVCLAAATRITAQLGGGRRAQLITALLVGTTPMVVLQATSTQTDLVIASWAACLATLVLDSVWRRARLADVLGLGAATGVLAAAKTTGLLAAGPLLVIWGVAQLRFGRARGWPGTVARTASASLGLLAVAAVLAGPYLYRMTSEFGSPLGPAELSTSIPSQRHDPAATLLNGVRIGLTALDTPVPGLRQAGAALSSGLGSLLHIPANDIAITFSKTTFPVVAWYPDEDRVSFPIAGTLSVVAVVIGLVRPRRLSKRGVSEASPAANAHTFSRHPANPDPAKHEWAAADPSRPGQTDPADPARAEPDPADPDPTGPPVAGPVLIRAYALVPSIGFVLYAATVKWQPWGNRLLLFLLVLAIPLAGIWLGRVTGPRAPAQVGPVRSHRRPGRTRRSGVTWPRAVTATVLAVSCLAGVLAVGYGYPRRLVGHGSVFTTTGDESRFVRRPQWLADYRFGADRVAASGAHRVGVVEGFDDWEYPWWVFLPGRDIVTLRSVLPLHPAPAPSSVDAIVCTITPDGTSTDALCRSLVPAGWSYVRHGIVGVALPPGK
jgi:hypothetical protein